MFKSIREFDVLPDNSGAVNSAHLQHAINWAAEQGAAPFVEPSDRPYALESGLVLRRNVSLVGVHGPVGRGTRHPDPARAHPVGSVLRIDDDRAPVFTVEGGTQFRGIQFWYPGQTLDDPKKIVRYPPTIRASQSAAAQGVTLSCLTFYGEFMAMDFDCANASAPCEQVLIEHCYGYPLSGEFIRINRCYDVPRLLHCHVNPGNQRFFRGQFSPAILDAVVRSGTYAYAIDQTDNAQLLDLFAFAVHGGASLGPATYGQLTCFNFDCVTVGIHKRGGSAVNRNWQISQGSIIANAGESVDQIHPIIIDGHGHTAISNVECFAGKNPVLTTLGSSQDFLRVAGNARLTVSLFGCRMRNYVADEPITVDNPRALVQAVACIDKSERAYNRTIGT